MVMNGRVILPGDVVMVDRRRHRVQAFDELRVQLVPRPSVVARDSGPAVVVVLGAAVEGHDVCEVPGDWVKASVVYMY